MFIKGFEYSLFAVGTDTRKLVKYINSTIQPGVEASYVIEILNVLSSEDIVCHLAEPSRPIIIQPTTAMENEDITILVMPMSVHES